MVGVGFGVGVGVGVGFGVGVGVGFGVGVGVGVVVEVGVGVGFVVQLGVACSRCLPRDTIGMSHRAPAFGRHYDCNPTGLCRAGWVGSA